MSIWSSCGGVEHCWEAGYGSERIEGSWVDIADSCYEPGQKMRLLVDSGEGPEADVALDREQVQQLVKDMQDWLTLADTNTSRGVR